MVEPTSPHTNPDPAWFCRRWRLACLGSASLLHYRCGIGFRKRRASSQEQGGARQRGLRPFRQRLFQPTPAWWSPGYPASRCPSSRRLPGISSIPSPRWRSWHAAFHRRCWPKPGWRRESTCRCARRPRSCTQGACGTLRVTGPHLPSQGDAQWYSLGCGHRACC